MTLQERIERPGPKRILSLDGGGIRGLITLGYLERMETLLAAGNSDFRLRDHFDLIGGTSTGAIIAAGLALGLDVKDIQTRYLDLGKSIFGRPGFIGGLTGGTLAAKFATEPVEAALNDIIGDRTLTTPDITTGLCIVTKRFDTNSVWPVVNAPDNRYTFHETQPNGAFRLSSIVRASTAAPTYFDPELVTLGPATFGFIDGGISMHNNPALQLLLVASAKAFGFGWGGPETPLHIVSIGTGEWTRAVPLGSWTEGSMPIRQVGNLVGMMMEDASALNETILQAMARGRNRRIIDRLTGDLPEPLWPHANLTYERFQLYLEEPFMTSMGIPSAYTARIDSYRKMDNIDHMTDLLDLGRHMAERQVERGDLG